MKLLGAFALMISLTVAANLLMKAGADAVAGQASLIERLLSWQLALGLACFGCAALVYALILGKLPLNVAQSFAAAQFVAVIAAAWLIRSEPINGAQWCGIALITAGILLVGWGR
jgi:drug/metabolite transporter (DMT)-like permease